MLKKLFTSNTRIKLLTTFLTNIEEEYYIRELTRKLDEQINSVRRELDNLKRAGFLKSRVKNRKKYYYINKGFIFYEELKSIILKANTSHQSIADKIEKMGKVKMVALSGLFSEQETKTVDMLIVGDIDKDKFGEFLNNDLRTQRPVKFTILSEDDYRYRTNLKDKFLTETIKAPETRVILDKL